MRPITITSITTVNTSPVIPLDFRALNFQVSISVNFSSGANATAKIQYTLDDPFNPLFNPSTANWVDHPFLNSLTATTTGNIAFPCTAIRLNVGAVSSGGVGARIIESSGAGA